MAKVTHKLEFGTKPCRTWCGKLTNSKGTVAIATVGQKATCKKCIEVASSRAKK